MAVVVRTIASHLQVTCCMGLPATAEVPRASHLWVMGLLIKLQKEPFQQGQFQEVDIFMYAVDKSSDILENILEEASSFT